MEENPLLSLILLFVIQALLYFSLMKGTKKVTEITARFTLDAMPIKGMAIDADLKAGAISFDEAKKRRTILTKEADFYQALDRVCELLNRYFIVYIILTLINLLGGIIIEVYLKKSSLYNAFSIYSTYTVGDSLCFIIPITIVSFAILVIATKSDMQNALYYGYEI
jgi:flagellar biosynthesis protein FlhA